MNRSRPLRSSDRPDRNHNRTSAGLLRKAKRFAARSRWSCGIDCRNSTGSGGHCDRRPSGDSVAYRVSNITGTSPFAPTSPYRKTEHKARPRRSHTPDPGEAIPDPGEAITQCVVLRASSISVCPSQLPAPRDLPEHRKQGQTPAKPPPSGFVCRASRPALRATARQLSADVRPYRTARVRVAPRLLRAERQADSTANRLP